MMYVVSALVRREIVVVEQPVVVYSIMRAFISPAHLLTASSSVSKLFVCQQILYQ
jgi:hypothetical protein